MMPFREGWPVRVPPQRDELLSSWFVRTAWANGEKLEPFTSRHFGSHSSFWKRDTDRFVDTAILVPLAKKSGLGRKKIFSMMLTPFEGVLYIEIPKTAVLPWVLPVRKVNRHNVGHSVMYCPMCLAGDEEPYFRRFWRLAFAVACPRHRVRLLDACQACGASVCYNAVDYTQHQSVGAFSLATCHRCRRDLRRSTSHLLPADEDVLRLTRSLQAAVIDGAPLRDPRDGRSSMQPIAYFLGLRWIARWLATRSATVKLSAAVASISGLPGYDRSQVDHLTLFEQRPTGERYILLRMLAWLLKDWPSHFILAAVEAGARPSYLTRYSDNNQDPYWIASVISTHLAAPRYSPTKQEQQNVIRLLQKYNLEPNANRVNRWLGKTSVYQHLKSGQQYKLQFDPDHEWVLIRHANAAKSD